MSYYQDWKDLSNDIWYTLAPEGIAVHQDDEGMSVTAANAPHFIRFTFDEDSGYVEILLNTIDTGSPQHMEWHVETTGAREGILRLCRSQFSKFAKPTDDLGDFLSQESIKESLRIRDGVVEADKPRKYKTYAQGNSYAQYDQRFEAWVTNIMAVTGWKRSHREWMKRYDSFDPYGHFDTGMQPSEFAQLITGTDEPDELRDFLNTESLSPKEWWSQLEPDERFWYTSWAGMSNPPTKQEIEQLMTVGFNLIDQISIGQTLYTTTDMEFFGGDNDDIIEVPEGTAVRVADAEHAGRRNGGNSFVMLATVDGDYVRTLDDFSWDMFTVTPTSQQDDLGNWLATESDELGDFLGKPKSQDQGPTCPTCGGKESIIMGDVDDEEGYSRSWFECMGCGLQFWT
jgi:hypothetical protein